MLTHLCSMYHSYLDYHMDFTRPQMLITIKLTTLAFNLGDTFHRKEEVCSALLGGVEVNRELISLLV